MSKVAVVYWSGTGNTEAMANAVADGAKEKGAEVTLFTASEFSSAKVAEFDGIAFGCPAMGAENLEESEFEPMFTDCDSWINLIIYSCISTHIVSCLTSLTCFLTLLIHTFNEAVFINSYVLFF